jgi:hypothetical protein
MSRPKRDLSTKLEVQATGHDPKRIGLIDLLSQPGLPGKETILRVKSLVREIAAEDAAAAGLHGTKGFMAAYFDLYLAKVTGDELVERSALLRCLDCLGTHVEPIAPLPRDAGFARRPQESGR